MTDAAGGIQDRGVTSDPAQRAAAHIDRLRETVQAYPPRQHTFEVTFDQDGEMRRVTWYRNEDQWRVRV